MTDQERWARVQTLFHEVLNRPEAERSRYLSEASGGDVDLEASVQSLLAAHHATDLIASLDEPAKLPRLYGLDRDRIGPFRIVRPLGQGGMGMVFLAVREEHDVTQTVALKILRVDFADPRLIERFRAERRILARLGHSGIARLITAGATDGGQPYFAMEFVDGTSLLEHCRRSRATMDDRLSLFLEICDAVEYAHQQLVIHRDLKPANVLVTEEGRPKLLDFGIAKLLDADDPESIVTRTAGWFTPEYASPEQLRRQPVTTLSDVYALGVMLYELLAGARPFDLRGLSPSEIEQRVSTVTPPRPSERATDAKVAKLLRGDLDTIILKALAAEPARRYASVRELAEDVRRFRAREPVRARPDSFTYRASRFTQRHRVGVAAAVFMALSLIGGLAAASWQAAVAADQRDRAEQALEESQKVSEFLAQLFQAADPTRSPGDTNAARAILRQGVAEVDGLAGQPLVQARMLDALGMVFVNLGEYDRAHQFIDRGLTLRRAELDSLHPDIVESLQHRGRVLRALSKYEEAERSYLLAADLLRRSGRPESPQAASLLEDLGFLMPYLGRGDDAARYYQQLLALRRKLHGDRHPSIGLAMVPIAGTHRRRGDYAAAESVLREAVDRHRRDIGPSDPRTATAYYHLGDIIMTRGGDSTEAERLYREGIAIHRAAGGPRSLGQVHGLMSLAELQSARRRHAEAESILREVLELNRTVFGSRGPGVAGAIDAVAEEMARQRRYNEAIPLKHEALAHWRDAVGSEHAAVASSLQDLASMLIENGNYAEAESVLTQVIDIRTRLHGPTTALIGLAQSSLGDLWYRQKRYAEAEQALTLALEILRLHQKDEHDDMRMVYHRLALVSEALGRREDADRYHRLAARN
jgi:tetratricopeptide (TPR) repeat protein/tRNA A-37 threonylcarbamoyl transferase component Bud32